MKKLVTVFLCIILIKGVNAQVKNPIRWTFSSKKINASTYEVHLTANIEKGWHIYSQTTPQGGPNPTLIEFTKSPLFNVQGPAKEIGKLELKQEEFFDVDVKQFSNKVAFVQTVKLNGKVKTSLNGTVEYMACNNRECLPPKKEKFSITLN